MHTINWHEVGWDALSTLILLTLIWLVVKVTEPQKPNKPVKIATRQPNVHDYTKHARTIGHDITSWFSKDGGITASLLGWGLGICVGDLLWLNPKESDRLVCYRVLDISYMGDPIDMWRADVEWVPLSQVAEAQFPPRACLCSWDVALNVSVVSALCPVHSKRKTFAAAP